MASENPEYVLHYFNFKGRAEVARLLFAVAGKKYTDKRYTWEEFKDEKTGLKKSMPFGQMPALDIDNVRYGQSRAIFRFLAREFGLAPTCTWELFYVDMFCGYLDDLGQKFPFSETDKDKEEKQEIFAKETAPTLLEEIEKRLVSSKDQFKDGHFVGKKLSIADLTLVTYGDFLTKLNAEVFEKAPELGKLYKILITEEKIAKWRKERPETEY